MRFNGLIGVIRSSLVNLQKALVGLVVMSADLEKLAHSMSINVIPAMWAGKSYPSLKPLGSYIQDLVERLAFFQNWIDNGQPVVSWISGIFFVHSFLTGALQNYARKYKVAVDECDFDFAYLEEEDITPTTPKPDDGVYVRGLFLEGARWCSKTKQLAESEPKILFTKAPIIWLKPCKPEDAEPFPFYNSPTYCTTARKGTLKTTGHSTNFIMMIRVPTDVSPSQWVKRGVALVSQLAD
jgi:dynein heavy chain